MTELEPTAADRPDTLAQAASAPGASEQKLRAQFDEIAQLAGGLAHEIRNPLSTMQLNLELLAEDFQQPETQRDRRVLQKVERLLRETQRLQDILEDFLRFVRVQELRKGPASLNAVVDDLSDFCEPRAASQNVILRKHLAHDLPLVPIDEELFKQALLNLILNALLAMPEGGDLILTTRSGAGEVVLEVVDTGCGIAPEHRPRVFDAFYSTRNGGSGLGLPTTRKIVEAHGGTISLESEPGKGSKFTIRLPLPAQPPEPAQAREE